MSLATPRCTTLIFDIGDVLYTWSPETPTPISPRTLKTLLSSSTWAQYESARITEAECYHRLAIENNIAEEDVVSAIKHARDSLAANDELFAFIRTLKDEAAGRLRVFAMSNISQPDYDVLRAQQSGDWVLFDRVFTSAAAGTRKPALGFYRQVLAATGCEPETTVFVDDKAENVLSARSLGMHGIVYGGVEGLRTALRVLVSDPLRRGWTFLRNNAGHHLSVTNTGVRIEDNFAQLLILELTGQRGLVNLDGVGEDGKVNFFKGKPVLTTSEYPCDLDTTSVALMVLNRSSIVVDSVMNEMLQFCNEDGIILTYFDRERMHMDPVVCVNVLALFYAHNRGAELRLTQDWVIDVLRHRAYIDGTRYYHTPEAFLYFFTRLLDTAKDPALRTRVRLLLAERLQERVGAPGDAMALAMRIIACAEVGIRNNVDMRKLLSLQLEDGSWGAGELYHYGKTGISIGNEGLATAFAIRAIESAQA